MISCLRFDVLVQDLCLLFLLWRVPTAERRDEVMSGEIIDAIGPASVSL